MNNFEILPNIINNELYAVDHGAEYKPVKFGKKLVVDLYCTVAIVAACSADLPDDFVLGNDLFVNNEWIDSYCIDKSMQISSKEALMLTLKQLPISIDWEEYGMDAPFPEVMKNARNFIQLAPDDNLLSSVHIFPRPNGTVLLKWNDNIRLASVNIGIKEISYAIHPRGSQLKPQYGEMSLQEEDISHFYERL